MLRCVAALCLVALAACDVSEGVPEGKLAVVGPTVLGPEDVAAARSQVGKYGQLRFSGPEGDATMLEALIAAELMALEANAQGFGDDPRVDFAVEDGSPCERTEFFFVEKKNGLVLPSLVIS